jgi:NAD(P)-dependent dehydrogenase (short-subunit alcohol dehydrogenase family)
MTGIPERFLGRLAGKVAIVTGAGAKGDGFGTGRAMSVLFGGEGARVCLVDRDQTALARSLDYLAEIGAEGFAVVADVTNAEDCQRIAAETLERFGKIDILVNNVGVSGGATPVDEIDIAQWRHVLDVNLQSAVLMAKYCVPAMRGGGGGAILNISSIAGVVAYGSLAYGPSKAALVQFTRDLAVLHGGDGIRVNALAPGHIYTPMVEGFMTEEMRAARRKAGPLALEGDAWDVAKAALFLVSDDAAFVNGVCLPVDGGVTVVGSTEAMRLMSRPG